MQMGIDTSSKRIQKAIGAPAIQILYGVIWEMMPQGRCGTDAINITSSSLVID